MNSVPRAALRLVLCGLAALLLAGCGSKQKVSSVKGTLTKGGKPLGGTTPKGPRPPGTEEAAQGVQMRFYVYNEGKRPSSDPNAKGVEAVESYTAEVKPDGTFTVPGRTGKGIPAGKYLVVVRQIEAPKGESEFAPGAAKTDKLKGAFSEEKSPIVVEITGDTDDLKIDLDEHAKSAPH